MPPLGPGIGEIDVQGSDRIVGQQPGEKIGGLDAQHPQVRQAGPAPFLIQLAQPAKQPFDPDEVAVRMPRRPLGEESAVTAAELDPSCGCGNIGAGSSRST
jgi:hypothetical protein